MRKTFGTRSAIRNLHESLEAGEFVTSMLACLYSGSDGLLVLTDRRALAVRDDYSKFRLQAISLADVRALDYAPTVHDGLAVLTDAGRIAVRKMDRLDSDAFTAALVARLPDILIGASHPHAKQPVSREPAHSSLTHPPPLQTTPDVAQRQSEAAVQAVTAARPVATQSFPTVAQVPPPGPAPEPSQPAPGADKEVLLSVLADLHAKGLLSSQELAAKISQVAGTP